MPLNFPAYLMPAVPFTHLRHDRPRPKSTAAPTTTAPPRSSSPSASSSFSSASTSSASSSSSCGSVAQPPTLRCATCSSELAFANQIVSKGFNGRYGRAVLVQPAGPNLLNVRVGKPDHRRLATGWHVVADIACCWCDAPLGWKYVDALEATQYYKIDRFILETERIVTHRACEDGDGYLESSTALPNLLPALHSSSDPTGIEFDSNDEDECEELFAGVWDPSHVVSRRQMKRQISALRHTPP